MPPPTGSAHPFAAIATQPLTAVSAGEAVVPASELAAARAEIAKLQRVLGKKTLENEILKEAVEYAAEKKWIARSPLLPGDDQ